MSFEEYQAEIALLLNQMEDQPEDIHELYEKIHARLAEMKAYGMPLPEDLTRLEQRLKALFAEATRT